VHPWDDVVKPVRQFRLETVNSFNHTNPIQLGTGGSSNSTTSSVFNQVLLARDLVFPTWTELLASNLAAKVE
jgi:hypothetical protein